MKGIEPLISELQIRRDTISLTFPLAGNRTLNRHQ